MAEADLAVLQDGAQKALNGGEEIASGARTMFTELESMDYDLKGAAGGAFSRVQAVMMDHLNRIDVAMNKVGNGIIDSSMIFNNADDDNGVSIEAAIGDENVALLTGGQ